MSITNFNYSTMPVYSNTQDNYKLNAEQQKMVHDHIVYYNKWGWVKPCIRYSIYGVLCILTVYWFVFATVALVNNPASQVNAICSNTGLNALLICQIVWSGFVTLERLTNYCYKKTSPPVICTLCVSGWCLFIWCFGALWGKCSRQKLTTLDVYKSVYSWFIIYSSIVSILFIRCCAYKKIKRMCCINQPSIITLEPVQPYQTSTYIRTPSPSLSQRPLSQTPLSQVKIPEEPINYAEL